jgi:predicted nucleic acid-binding protein
MLAVEGRFLLDTNVLIYATLDNDPRAVQARAAIEHGKRADCEAFVSVQNLAEMYPNLTGPKTEPPDSPHEASQKIIRLASLTYVEVLPITVAVTLKALELAERYQVARQRFFDMQLVAALVVYDIPTLVTENKADFAAIAEIAAVNPFA